MPMPGTHNTLQLWDLEQGDLLEIYTADAAIWAVAITPDGQKIVAGDTLGQLHFFALELKT